MMTKKRVPSPPSYLSREGKKLWRDLTEEYVLEDPGAVAILTAALESFDRCATARRTLAADGLTVRDRYDQVKVHPLASVIRDAEAAFRAGLRQLGVGTPDTSPPNRPGRPSAKGGI